MKEINVLIYLDHDVLKLSCLDHKRVVGTSWNNKGQLIKLVRPPGYDQYNRMLLLSDGRKQYEKNIGTDNEFTITNAVEQNLTLYLGLYFFDGANKRVGANTLEFKYRRAPQDGSTPEEFVTAQIGTVKTTTLAPGSAATAAVDYTDSKLNF